MQAVVLERGLAQAGELGGSGFVVVIVRVIVRSRADQANGKLWNSRRATLAEVVLPKGFC